MAHSEFPLPDVGEGLTEAEIVTWKVKPGDAVAVNQVLVEIETAKSLVELPCPFAGTVAELLVDEGATVRGQCGAGPYHVTAYVSPGGAPLSVGVATDSSEAGARLDCVATAVRDWRFPDPGSYAGKVSFNL